MGEQAERKRLERYSRQQHQQQEEQQVEYKQQQQQQQQQQQSLDAYFSRQADKRARARAYKPPEKKDG